MTFEVFRDGHGVPHCYAGSEREAFFAQGWVHADDRLFQMDYDRRRAMGRWAEVVGERAVAADTFYRRLDLLGSVRRDLEALDPATRRMLDAYAAGVNRRIASGRMPREFEIAGVEPEPWEPVHRLLVHRVRHVLMGPARSKLWRSLVRRVLGEDVARQMVNAPGEENVSCVPPGAPAASAAGLGGGDVDGGSNNWALTGRRTASGLPLLAGDPHRDLEAPNVYVQGHVACPEWDVLGIGMPGVPGFPHFGHNARVAWSITHAMADDQDLYEIGEGHISSVRTDLIEVRGADPVEIEIERSHRGPVVGAGLAFAWTATAEPNRGLDALVPMLRARSVAELFEAMRPWVEPANSLLAVDVDGTIGYQLRGTLPRRRRGEAAWFPVPAGDASFGWDGWVPFDDLPRCLDPDEGFLFSANNTIAADPDAPYVGIDVAPPWRALRITAGLDGARHATVDDMAALQRDLVSLPAARLAARLDWEPLRGWDGTMDRDSPAAAAYAVFRRELMLLALERSGLGDMLDDPMNRLLPGVVPETALWRVIGAHLDARDVSLLGGWTWDQAIAAVRERVESVWHGERWGDLHRTAVRHPLLDQTLDPPPVATHGDPDTVMVGASTPTLGHHAKTGSVARYVWDPSDWDASGWVVPLGAAGDPAAPHGTDQQDAWRDGILLPAPYTRAAVETAAVARRSIPSA